MRWLVQDALPLWTTRGFDPATGGFHEGITQAGVALNAPRRARVAPRQLYAIETARALGGDLDPAFLIRAMDGFLAQYLRSDGLVRTLVSPEGLPLDDAVSLYDQPFALLALATLTPAVGARAETVAAALRDQLVLLLKHPLGGFREGRSTAGPMLANPNMHLLEAFLAWDAVSDDLTWSRLAGEIAEVALSRMIDPATGALSEVFDGDWSPAPLNERRVEPGHQFEWGWLLMRWSRLGGGERARRAALRLIEIGEICGVDPDRNVAVNLLGSDLAVTDAGVLLWPQTERVKAHAQTAKDDGHPQSWTRLAASLASLERFLTTPAAGLWFDIMGAGGEMMGAHARATSFYHLAGAIAAADAAVSGG